MARIRSVHPRICESEDLVDIPAEVERTFVRLWTHCDDEGRAKDVPLLIKAALFPLHLTVTAEDVDQHLQVLAEHGLIVRYRVAGKPFLSIPSWGTYQHPQKPRKSDIPGPDEADPVEVRDGYATPTEPVDEGSGPVVGVGEGEGVVEGEGEESSSSSETEQGTVGDDDPVDSALHRLAGSDLARRQAELGPVGNVESWLSSARAARRRDHYAELRLLHHQHPTWDADQLAAHVLNPPAPVEASPVDATVRASVVAMERNERRDRGEACPMCSDSGWVEDDEGNAWPCSCPSQGFAGGRTA